jgi:adenosylhomocysteine nucleosidase
MPLQAGRGESRLKVLVVMTVGIICAIPEELTHLRAALEGAAQVEIGRRSFDLGVLDEQSVVLVGAGMGKVNAAVTTTMLVDRFDCRAVVLSGVAGGVDPGLRIGDIVVAKHVLQHDAGKIADERLDVYQAGHVVFINPTDVLGYRVDQELLARVRDRLCGLDLASLPLTAGGTGRAPRITFGTVLTGDQYLHCDATRQRLHREFGAQAIEMEGGAVAQVAESFGVPWLVIRALSDLAGHDSSIDFGAFAEVVAATSATLVRRILPVV